VQIPADLMNYVTEHLPALVRGDLNEIAVRTTTNVLTRPILRLLGYADPGDVATIRLELDRLQTMVSVFQVTLEDLVDQGKVERIVSEAREPAFQQFAFDTCAAAIASPIESKRTLLGRMLAKRAGSPTDSFYAVQMRQALNIEPSINEVQMYLLGTVYLIKSPPLAVPVSGMSYREVDLWLHRRYSETLERFLSARWDWLDAIHLLSLSALQQSESQEQWSRGKVWESATTPIEQDLHRVNIVPPFNEGGPPLTESYFRRIRELSARPADKDWIWPGFFPLGAFDTSPAGHVIAATLVEQFTGEAIDFSGWEGRMGRVEQIGESL